MNELPKTFELDEQIFKEAVFESIRLWCTSEYFYSENLKNALNQFKDNNYIIITKISVNELKFMKIF